MMERMLRRKTDMRIIGLEEAVEDYRKAKAGKWYHGSLMFDRNSGEVWTEFSYDEDMSWICSRESGSVVNLGERLTEDAIKGLWESFEISVENVRNYIAWKFSNEGDANER